MASNTDNTNLKADAAPFVPGLREHSSCPPQLSSSYAPTPQPYYGPPHHPSFAGLQPLHSPYSNPGSYYPSAASVPWYTPNANSAYQNASFDGQLHQSQGEGQSHNGSQHPDQNREGDGTNARGNAKTKSYRNINKKGKKNSQEKKGVEEEEVEENREKERKDGGQK